VLIVPVDDDFSEDWEVLFTTETVVLSGKKLFMPSVRMRSVVNKTSQSSLKSLSTGTINTKMSKKRTKYTSSCLAGSSGCQHIDLEHLKNFDISIPPKDGKIH
jgi:hypothetical protein